MVLVGWPPMDTLDPSWRRRLLPEYSKPYFQRLMAFHGQEIDSGKTIYPPSEDVFTAFNLCPFDKTRVRTSILSICCTYIHSSRPLCVKVVIIGQDPYHGKLMHEISFDLNMIRWCDSWRSRPGPWTRLLRAQGRANSSIPAQHDHRSYGEIVYVYMYAYMYVVNVCASVKRTAWSGIRYEWVFLCIDVLRT